MVDSQDRKQDLLELTGQIVSSHVQNNKIKREELPLIIEQVFETLQKLSESGPETQKIEPAVPIADSIQPEYIVCLEDGKQLKMLKRHLRTLYNLTPEEYRDRWGLPSDYPMVAPQYAEKRRSLAKEIGLGRGRS